MLNHMVKHILKHTRKNGQSLDRVFAALSDPTRRAILERLIHSDESVGNLARPFEISLPAISKHLRVLEHCGLLTQTKRGRIRLCRIEKSPLQAASKWLTISKT